MNNTRLGIDNLICIHRQRDLGYKFLGVRVQDICTLQFDTVQVRTQLFPGHAMKGTILVGDLNETLPQLPVGET